MTSTCISAKNMDSQLAKSGKHNLARVDTPISTPPTTPTPAATTAHDLHREIRNIYQRLAPLTSLAPSDLVNTLLSRLVNLCIRPYSAEIVDHFSRIDGVDMLCHDLQRLCAIAEGELERYWAQSILKDAASHTGASSEYHHSSSPTVLELSEELQRVGFEILAEMHPWSDVVNSVIILRVTE
ncbi:uncharacterized protein N0V89_007451 [Didymosphaeria variabile]|uniref:Uncharacterized protein n=1 Tax=Didymosphaeria variabile TaxID=1932322 RepID=A0A9W9CA71_9PLEO|nr:uncharacterized protein N0V89_007451 [Didymosphaeria variabile]KAJ4352105.1 hypothetical protein N0V89_007451 [Didymosphaeria variabile]